MKNIALQDLQASVQDNSAFGELKDYFAICNAFLQVMQKDRPTRIVSPSQSNYIFYQYAPTYGHKITRPLNSNLFFEDFIEFEDAFETRYLNTIFNFATTVVQGKPFRSGYWKLSVQSNCGRGRKKSSYNK